MAADEITLNTERSSKTQPSTPVLGHSKMSKGTNEEFVFGKYRFDIDRVRECIATNALPFSSEMVSIKPWAEQVLLLDRAHPELRRVSFLVGIDYNFLPSITPERCREPIYVATLDFGMLVIDGNHRVACAYVFDAKATEMLLHDSISRCETTPRRKLRAR